VADVSPGTLPRCDAVCLRRHEGGVTMAMIGVIVGEFITAQAGLGGSGAN
jgi:ABC-type nitrate/sulfonate/bicarbonate transport system permease component